MKRTEWNIETLNRLPWLVARKKIRAEQFAEEKLYYSEGCAYIISGIGQYLNFI